MIWHHHKRVAIKFTESAGKHGFTVEDAIWAMQHARLVKPELDESRVPGRARPTFRREIHGTLCWRSWSRSCRRRRW